MVVDGHVLIFTPVISMPEDGITNPSKPVILPFKCEQLLLCAQTRGSGKCDRKHHRGLDFLVGSAIYERTKEQA